MADTHKTYVVTSAQAFAKPNDRFLDSLEAYVERNDAELIVLPMIGKSSRETDDERNFHGRIREYGLEYGARKLNKNIAIEQFAVRPYQVDPITGLERFAQRERSLVFASPKQRWRYIPHSNAKMPKALISTGAATMPNYAVGEDESPERRRLGGIAKRDHEYGAIVVDVVSGKRYHWRNLIALKNGRMSDLGREYSGDAVHEREPLAMVCGDWHAGYTDESVKDATLRMIEHHRPRRLVLHDFVNGHSVSHHMPLKMISEMVWEGVDKRLLSLEDELAYAGRDLETLASTVGDGTIYIVQSNHHDGFLNRYLDEGRFVKDPVNLRLALRLASAYADRKDPVEEGLRLVYGIPENVVFLSRIDDLKVNGYQLASHGDKGPAGGKGSVKSKENDFGKSITGHVHKSEKLRQTFTVGSMLPFDMHYIRGDPVAWTNSHAFIYDTGVQMVNVIEGAYQRV